MEAGRNGDVATLRGLRRAGCPWAPSPATLRRALYGSCFHGGQGWRAVLELVEREGGCRVDWGEVEEVASGARPGWLREDMGKGDAWRRAAHLRNVARRQAQEQEQGQGAGEEEVSATCLTSVGWVWRLVLGSLGWGDGNGADVAGARGA